MVKDKEYSPEDAEKTFKGNYSFYRKGNCNLYHFSVIGWFWVIFQCRGVLLIWIVVGQEPIALAVSARGGCLDFFHSSIFSLFLLPL